MQIKPNTINLIVQSTKPFVDNGLLDREEIDRVVKLLQTTEEKEKREQSGPRMVTRQAVAKILCVSLKTVDRLAAEKKLNRVKIGNLTRFRYRELLDLMDY